MRAPAFWAQPTPSPVAHALRPIAAFYGAIASHRLRRSGMRAPVPVICIGNFTAGGAGKTPTAIAVGQLLQQAGHRPVFLTRGYGGRFMGPLRVGSESRADDVGDEALLLARVAPTILARDRKIGAKLAATHGNVIVMDDGLQNPSLQKDLAIAVVDGGTGIGNGLCIPAGPLRASLAAQWPLVHTVVVIGEGPAGDPLARDADRQGKPVFGARLVPNVNDAERVAGKRVLAFAGIGRPAKFFQTLLDAGAIVEREIALPDHHRFRDGEVDDLIREARGKGLRLVTTEKDAARLSSSHLEDVTVLRVSLALDNSNDFAALIADKIRVAPPPSPAPSGRPLPSGER
ncbi:tetraacyldisaccharide 4'-kinase [Microvirga massiliensis]|uniref:tetraacyldisaccharide 4'-kinase n=1 Tax=Microvirga massiliensis TaxID=1033741 RepID=UPI00062B9800|nr:tetraacyldisaccharide 4'-kinase [Microvirga massiliensis]